MASPPPDVATNALNYCANFGSGRNSNIGNPDVHFVHGHSLQLSREQDNETHRTVNRDNCKVLHDRTV